MVLSFARMILRSGSGKIFKDHMIHHMKREGKRGIDFGFCVFGLSSGYWAYQDIEHILNEDILSVCGYFLTWSRTSRAHTLNNTTLFLFQLIINRNLGIPNVQTRNKLPNSDITAPLFKTHRPSLFNNSGLYSIIRLILVHWFQLLQGGGYWQQIHWP